MPFETRVFVLAKDPQHPEQCQDAFGLNAAGGIAAVADGVSSALFSRQWAQIVTLSVVADPPDPAQTDVFNQWLAARRQEWSAQIDTSGLAWFQKAKLPNGAFSTLVWVQLLPVEEEPEVPGAFRLHGFAIGDSCLFHIRNGETLRTFPIENSAELEADPIVLGSVDLSRDDYLQFHQIDVQCHPDDVIVLCTDAIVDWALRGTEGGSPPNWNDYWTMSDEQWIEEINGLRESRAMRYDDATLALLRVLPEGTQVQAAEGSPSTFVPAGTAPAPQPAPAEPAAAVAAPEAAPVESEAAPAPAPAEPAPAPSTTVPNPFTQSASGAQETPTPVAQPVLATPTPAAAPAAQEEYEEPEDEEEEYEEDEYEEDEYEEDDETEDEDDEEEEDEDSDDWKEKFKGAGEQLAEGLEIAGGKAIKGLKGWMKKLKKKK